VTQNLIVNQLSTGHGNRRRARLPCAPLLEKPQRGSNTPAAAAKSILAELGYPDAKQVAGRGPEPQLCIEELCAYPDKRCAGRAILRRINHIHSLRMMAARQDFNRRQCG
jgi:hypothetical protein